MGQLCTTGMTKMPPWGAGRVQPKNMLRPPATAEPMAQAGMTLSLIHISAAALATTRQYLFLCALGIAFIVGYNAVSGILRGLGDSRTPLLLIALACVINVSTDVLFVGVMRQGAAGAAVSTVLAQVASLVLALFYLAGRGLVRKYRGGAPCFKLVAAKQVLATGAPIALQEGLVNLSFLIITAILNGLGPVSYTHLSIHVPRVGGRLDEGGK